LDEWGTLELTFGGGEPFLHPDILEVCKWIWINTNLGISITTNGSLLNEQVIDEIKNYISFLRVSIDGSYETYKRIKNIDLESIIDNIQYLRGNIPYGLNVIARPGCIDDVDDSIKLGVEFGAKNILIIPEHRNGKFILNRNEWDELRDVILTHSRHVEIYITHDAINYVNIHTLDLYDNEEFSFAHISADKKLKINSFQEDGISINDDLSNLFEGILSIRNLYFKSRGE